MSAGSPGPGSEPPEVHGTVSAILDTLLVGTIMLDGSTGRVLLWNPMTEEILGWRAGQVVGRPVREFLADGRGHSEEDRRRTLRRTHRWRGTVRVRHADGRLVPVEARVSLLHDEHDHPVLLANIVESSRLRALEHDLAALDALFASSPLGIALFDAEGRFSRVNDALTRLNGALDAEVVGKRVEEVLPPPLADEVVAVRDYVLRTGRPVVDRVMRAPDGTVSRSASFSRLTDSRGAVLGASAVVMDITERLEALEKIETARKRLALLDDVGVALAGRFDVQAITQALASALVPRFADYAGVMLARTVLHSNELPDTDPAPGGPLLQAGWAGRRSGPEVETLFRPQEEVRYVSDSVFGRTLATGVPRLLNTDDELHGVTFPGDPKAAAAQSLRMHSLLVVPLRARGVVLGLLNLSRSDGRERFDGDDLALTMELADRAGISLDNARLYSRERAGALVLQRSLLPQQLPAPPGVRVAYRYVPAGVGTEVGGDWFDTIPLAGGRVAFLVGDVMGHGLNAAVTMGRLRTAVRTLAALDLPPDELLRHVNDLTDDFTHGDDPLLATCVYAVYDPSTRRCAIASAGHPPPLLLVPRGREGWRAHVLDLPPGVPIGVGGLPFEAVELDVPARAVLVLYTDGLIERRDEDISTGIERLAALLSSGPADAGDPADPGADPRYPNYDEAGGGRHAPDGLPTLDDACDTVLADLERRTDDRPDDDVALLLATLGGLPAGSTASWTFPAENYAARRARDVVRATLREWGLAALEDTAVLLVSELVTNSLRYAHGPIGVRMVRGGSLLLEISDPLPDPPRERNVTPDDEGGRGIQLVAREARRWGTRHGPMGKTVWFELALP